MKTGLVQPGTLVRWRYALKLPAMPAATRRRLAGFRERIKAELPEAGFTIADRRDPSPQVTRTLERLRQFLTMLGLAVAAGRRRRRRQCGRDLHRSPPQGHRHLQEPRRHEPRHLHALPHAGDGHRRRSASSSASCWATSCRCVINALLRRLLPIQAALTVTPPSVGLGAVYGLLVALLFTLWPLGRAELVRASVLFRDEVAPGSGRCRAGSSSPGRAVAAALVALAVLMSDARLIALYFCIGVTVMFAVFWASARP